MATAKNILKNWFLNGKKPPQEQFWAWLESYWHKDEKIPVSKVEGLSTLIENADITNVLNQLEGQLEEISNIQELIENIQEEISLNGGVEINGESFDNIEDVVKEIVKEIKEIESSIEEISENGNLENGIEIGNEIYNNIEEALNALIEMLNEALANGGGKGLISGDPFEVSANTPYKYTLPEDSYLFGVLVKDAASLIVGNSANGDDYGNYDGNPGGVLELGFLKATEVYVTSSVTTEITPILYMNRPLTGDNSGGGGSTSAAISWAEINDKPTTFPPSEHFHDWADINGKPEKFPPAEHSHNYSWEELEGKPLAFPPVAHTHSYNDLTDKPNIGVGQVVVAGKVGCAPRRVMKTFTGNFQVQPYPEHTNWKDHHKIVHNLGHTDYILTGAALQSAGCKRTIKVNCFYMSANYCYVVTADDDTANPADFVFQITSFR